MLALFVLQTAEQALAIALFAGFLIGAPVLALAGRRRDRGAIDAQVATVAAFWCLYVMWFLACGIVHLEDRYMLPVLPATTLGGLVVWRHALHQLRGRRFAPLAAREPAVG